MAREAKSESDAAPASRESKQEADYNCAAAFCPARATMFDSTSGPPRGGVCRYHNAASPSQWPAVTALLNRTQSIEETNAGLDDLGLAVRVTVPYQPPLPSIQGETPAEIMARLKAMLSGPKNPDAWWQKLIRRWHDGEVLLPIQQSAARSAWLIAGCPAEWAPPHPAAGERLLPQQLAAARMAVAGNPVTEQNQEVAESEDARELRLEREGMQLDSPA